MSFNNPVETLAASFYKAVSSDLLNDEYDEMEYIKDASKPSGMSRVPTGKKVQRRPSAHECEAAMFSQLWSSTALGFGGIGGAAMTTAYTVIVMGVRRDACVYFGGRLAYLIENPNQQFFEDIAAKNMHQVSGAKARYSRA